MKSEILEVKQLTAVVSFWNEKYTLTLEIQSVSNSFDKTILTIKIHIFCNSKNLGWHGIENPRDIIYRYLKTRH